MIAFIDAVVRGDLEAIERVPLRVERCVRFQLYLRLADIIEQHDAKRQYVAALVQRVAANLVCAGIRTIKCKHTNI